VLYQYLPFGREYARILVTQNHDPNLLDRFGVNVLADTALADRPDSAVVSRRGRLVRGEGSHLANLPEMPTLPLMTSVRPLHCVNNFVAFISSLSWMTDDETAIHTLPRLIHAPV
jgi:hypothetical protein